VKVAVEQLRGIKYPQTYPALTELSASHCDWNKGGTATNVVLSTRTAFFIAKVGMHE